ncbi:hypothetical protein OsJ_02965 [Oryza sativa Japonica Group]|uniref:Uncharacterized protein n=1 Tax=Oryza sativa subsp. japonica TaxID=39947 RepID=B9EYJ4_ORYSJ|nr:hypothetical protein OsJ_02965 [Oryza sativa Japonica Group]
MVGNLPPVHPHAGSRAVHEYQFLPEQPSDRYEGASRSHEGASRSHYYDTPVEASNSRMSSHTPGSHLLRGSDEAAPGYAFQGQMSGSGHLPQSGRREVLPAVPTDYEMIQSNSDLNSVPVEGQYGISQVAGIENSLLPSERRAYHDEDGSRVDRKRKHNEEAKIAKEVEAHERRIRKELEKQDMMKRKREEQMRKEMERHDRERRKEEERLLRERQREQERFLREQRREHERMEKFMQKQSRRAEKQRQKEELRKEKEAARQKAANERATARRIAREYMELVEDECLELMELAAQSKGLPSMLSLDSDTLQQLDSFRGMLTPFPPEPVRLKEPFSIKPWTVSEDNVGNLLMTHILSMQMDKQIDLFDTLASLHQVWKFSITFADVLGLSSVTFDEFVQSLHDYDSRLLGELHIALLKSIIKDIEDVSRTPSVALAVNPAGGHPQIVEGAYAWGFNIRSWQRHLNVLTWPEILRQFALSAGFGPQLKKRNAEDVYYRDDNEGHDGQDVISTLRNGSAAVHAAALMKERGYTHRRRSRHRLTPGTVKFAAFHVLSLEGSKGLTILEVAERIQKSGLRDLTTSKTPEASIAAALSRDTKLFERTAPSTYCVKSPYRKDPADSEVVLSSAREKIRAFQNVISDSEAEKEANDAERDEDSECDDADDDPDGKPSSANTSSDSPVRASSEYHEVPPTDAEDKEIDESNQGESWVHGLAEGDYCDLSVEERLNALVALVSVANEGNFIRAVLEERLESANALKKQMLAEAQLDKRRSKEEFAGRVQYNSNMNLKADVNQENATESTPTPFHNVDKHNDGNTGVVDNNNNEIIDHNSNAANASYERNGLGQDIAATPDTLSVQQYAYADKTRSQLRAYIGHRAEQLFVYRSLPLGQDRRRNRYWQFSTSASPNDPEAPKPSLGKPSSANTSSDSPVRASSEYHEVPPTDAEDKEIDESNQGESWVHGLAEGDYCDLSVEERLNALVALVSVANEGNFIRAVLEERLESANALKKQMLAEAQLDKRRSKEEFAGRVQYNSNMNLKADVNQENATESTPTPFHNVDKHNDGNTGVVDNNNNEIIDHNSNAANASYERNGLGQDIAATPDTLSVQQYAYADKTRSQLRAYIGHRAEQLFVYRSLPLGQDRRRNRYWQFSTSASPNDPGSGRIFFECRDGYWRVLDTEEAFDSLVASLDTRGSREAQLHSMLQRIEPTFKEAIKRKKSAVVEQSAGRYLKNGATEMIRASYRSDFGSPSSNLSGVTSDSAIAYSDSFKIELGRNDVEKTAISKRADVFIRWMWRECNDCKLTCAMEYGKKRCSELMHSCNYCYQIYLAEERHCSSCHKNFKSIHNFSDHASQCKDKLRTDHNWKMQTADHSVPIGVRLLKLQLSTIEASIPPEAIQPFWTDGYRKSWGVKLHSTTSLEEIFQMLTLLEAAIKRDHLSSEFETTSELLNLNTQDNPSQNHVGLSGSAAVLPWVPDTTAAIALRMLDLDSAVSYMQNQKMERNGGDFMKPPSRFVAVKNAQELDPLETTGLDLFDGRWATGSGRRGRGRGSRGGSRGGRGRSRGGRVPRGISISSRIGFKDENEASRKNTRRGRTRGRGRGRGRRTVRSRQPSEGKGRSIPKENLLGSFSMLSNAKAATVEESPRSSGADEWGLENRRPYIDGDENSSGSQLDQSEDNEENGQPMDEEYDEQVPDYSRGYSGGSRPHGMIDDDVSEEEDEDVEGDDDGEEDDADRAVDDVDAEMDEDDDIGDDGEDGGDGGDGVEANADEDEGGSSYSSEYSD